MIPQFNDILGTADDDRIEGTEGDDLIRGLEGNDNIQGGAGNDVVIGGPGSDRILGDTTALLTEGGDDIILDPDGEDVITGGGGNDILIGGRIMNGDGGDDLLISTGAAAAVTFIGSAGADVYFGSDDTAETYSYLQFARESDPENPDVIYNFQSGQDVFDFGGEQAEVRFIGDGEFSDADDAVTEARFENGLLELDIDNDQVADLAFELIGVDTFKVDDLEGFIIDGTAEEPEPEPEVVQVFGNIGTDTFVGSNDVREIYRYNFFADDSPADAPDVIQNFQPGQDSIFFGELGTRVDYLGDAAFSGDADPLLGIEARFEDGRLEIDEDSDAVPDKVIILEGVETLTEADFFI
ncbi:calcium-binding protein [Yoonia sp. 2307UL14-13]|uniref:calcium-binding protein n=1 Tax=Yoonia sp. 2307UL14-13 TaxID=3126506 RepID=UPI0030B6C970